MTDYESDPLDVLEYSDKTAKRATHENLELTPLGDGEIQVRNASHADPSDHTYTVYVQSGIPYSCECPAYEYGDGSACKHMVRVAVSKPIIDAVDGGGAQLATDGGQTVDEDGATYTYHREPARIGGARYVRCELCGRESVPANPDRILHERECLEARR